MFQSCEACDIRLSLVLCCLVSFSPKSVSVCFLLPLPFFSGRARQSAAQAPTCLRRAGSHRGPPDHSKCALSLGCKQRPARSKRPGHARGSCFTATPNAAAGRRFVLPCVLSFWRYVGVMVFAVLMVCSSECLVFQPFIILSRASMSLLALWAAHQARMLFHDLYHRMQIHTRL